MKITLANLAKEIKNPATMAKTIKEASFIRRMWWEYKLNKLLPKFISETDELKWKFVVINVDKYINPMTGNVIDVNYANAKVIIRAKISNYEWEFTPETSTIWWVNGIHRGVWMKYNSESKVWEKTK